VARGACERAFEGIRILRSRDARDIRKNCEVPRISARFIPGFDSARGSHEQV